MKTNNTIELKEQYSAPSCKAVETRLRSAILAMSTDSFTVDSLEEENW